VTTSVVTFNLAGQVRHQGLSIAGAEVLLFDLFKAEAAGLDVAECMIASRPTGSRGEFNFDVRPGKYRLEVVPDANTRFLRHSIAEIDVYNNTKCSINLITGFTCRLRLGTTNSVIGNGAEVLALGIEPSSYRASATIGDDGGGNIILPKGKFHVAFRTPQQSAKNPENSDFSWARTVCFLTHSVTILEVDGDDTFDLSLPKLVSLEGAVTDVFGMAVKGAKVTVSSSVVPERELLTEMGVGAACWTDGDGLFKIWLEAGVYDIFVEPDDGGRLFALRESNVDIFAATKRKIQLMEGFKLRGQVHYENSTLAQSLIRIISLDRRFETNTKTDDNGQFAVGLPGGNYKIVVSAHPKDAPSIVLDGCEFSGLAPWSRNIVVGGDTHVAVRLKQGTPLYGKIADDAGQSRPGVKVSIFGGSEGRNADESVIPLSSTVTDGEGKYCFFLAPGNYQVAVNDDLAKSQTVSIENDPLQLDVDWHGWCQLKFEIIGENGQKLPRCRVTYGPYGTSVYEFTGELQYDHETALPRGNLVAGEDGVCHLTIPAGVYFFKFTPLIDGSFESKMIKQLSVSADFERTIKLPFKSRAQ